MPGPWEAYSGSSDAAQGPWNAFAPSKESAITIRPVGSSKPDLGVVDAAARGAAQGATFGFGDELQALSEAGGASKDFNGIQHLIGGLVKYIAGNAEARKQYEEAVARERELNKTAEEQHPIASTIGQVGGALALPIGAGAGAATLPARMGIGAGTGAIMGGLTGAGEGEGAADTATKAAAGTVVGGVLGGAAPAVIEGVSQGVRAAAGPIINQLRGAFNPEAEAGRRVITALQRDAKADPNAINRLTPAEYAAEPTARIVDAGGELTRRLADSAAITSPEGGNALKATISDRFRGQTARIVDWFNNNFNFPNADATAEAIKNVAKNVNRANYERVMNAHPVVTVPAEITDRPAVAQAMKDAVSLAKNYGEKLQGPVETKTILSGPGYHIADDVENPAKTSLRYWDYVKKALDARIEKAKRGGGIEDLNSKEKADFRGLVDARNALVEHLDNVASEYKAARSGAAAFFGAENALEAGAKIVTDKRNNREIAKGLAKMSPIERKLAQDGFVDEYIKTIRESGDSRSILNKINDAPAARERLNMILGTQKAAELEAKLRIEGIMDRVRTAVTGNSWTAQRLYNLGLAGGAGLSAHGGYETDPKEITYGLLIGALASGGKKIDQRVAQKVAEMLVSRDPKVLAQGFRVVSGNGGLMAALRKADNSIARVVGEQAPTGPALQAAGVSRASDQPDVPRPPGQ